MVRRPHVFVGGSTIPGLSEEYYKAAKYIGEEIYKNKYTLVFDGCYGLPGVAASQQINKEPYSENVLICAANRSHRFPYKWIEDTIEGRIICCKEQSEVTARLIDVSDYLIFMRGSSGTNAELFQAIDTKKNKEHNKLIIILNIDHQWDHIINVIKIEHLENLCIIAETPEQTMEYIRKDLEKLGYKEGINFFGRESILKDISR